jgi:protein-tyrosine phosphatase
VTPPFQILYVCVGNICRSVLAERLTRLELARHPTWWADCYRASSAGTLARSGRPMHPETARILGQWAADPASFAARRVIPAIVRDSDLVLTATRRERDDVLAILPAALGRTFTLNEFARLAESLPPVPDGTSAHDPAALGRRTVADVLARRGRPSLDVTLPDDIADPVADATACPAAFDACAGHIARTVRLVISALRRTSDTYAVPAGAGGRGGPVVAAARDRDG